MKNRNFNYDLLRLLGLLIIMVAHSSPPGWLFQLRNFGTPLLVLGSGLTYSLIYSQRQIEAVSFLKKRLPKLILPAWIFLSFFFVCLYAAATITNKDFPFKAQEVLTSYIFMEGIGFVWIFKIYLMLAIVTPIAIYLNNRCDSNLNYLAALIAAYVVYELVLAAVDPLLAASYKEYVDSIIFTFIPYSLVYLYAFRLTKISDKTIITAIVISLVIFVVLAIVKYQQVGEVISTQKYKYPPTIYYLSYAFFAINTIYLCIRSIKISSITAQAIVTWLSSNSLWIYLWHIFAFYIWEFTSPMEDGSFVNFIVKSVFLFGFGISMTLIQNRIVFSIRWNNYHWNHRIVPLIASR
ncbi:acyltransferase family protein [Shewanella sp.]|uniref:acyltransferase family protein n=1 Tax=Shewanella sp. TaxID=50422 RepID=UPI003A96F014